MGSLSKAQNLGSSAHVCVLRSDNPLCRFQISPTHFRIHKLKYCATSAKISTNLCLTHAELAYEMTAQESLRAQTSSIWYAQQLSKN